MNAPAVQRKHYESRRRLAELSAALGPLAQENVSLGSLTTYRVGGPAALFVQLEDEAGLARLMEVLACFEVDVLVVGKGSNLLVADSGWPGLAVRLGGTFQEIDVLPGEAGEGRVSAGGAASYPTLARRSAAAGLFGMEWAVGIPGSVGGAVRMNAGGHGAETGERLASARIVALSSGSDSRRAVSDLALSYRGSSLRPDEVVLEASFRLDGGPEQDARARVQASSARIGEIVAWRRANQPGGQNAGSIFTNPAGDSAGRLIDAAGLKGLRIGTAAVSTKHANFFQADRGGRADDVARLISAVRHEVARSLGVELSVEVRMVGFGEEG